ncbi:hypothetical protein HG537_0D04580 [Torulaspora globosa]|uniref:Major facilitator superfamily (MFS) profile domain-containing protein n=1 Tax=Torulaspora globosa TaxID=48254 RepID=A0A7H9HRT6_9SACH|nr:hypothetical protein HG537_0D04580 [Torulaspora sp. CBS 2947]
MSLEPEKQKYPVTETEEIEVPDGGYGWVVLIAFFLFNFCTWGANAGYAIYLNHYLEYDTFAGGTKLDYSAIGGIAFGAGLLFAPLITWFSHKCSVHITIAIGIVFQGLGLMLAAFSKKLWQLYLTQGLLISFGLAFIFIPCMTLLPQWFRKKRSVASGVGTSGSGLGGIIFNLAMQRITELKNVKWALITQFIICTSLSTLALMLTRTRRDVIFKDKDFKIRIVDKQVFSKSCTWLLCGWISFTMLGYVILLYSLSAFTTSLGYTAKQGSIVSCMISVGNLFGRPVIGHLADRYGPISVGVVVHLIVAIFAWAMWIPCKNLATAIVFALIEGALMGTIWPTVGSIAARVVGLKKLDVTLGLSWLLLAIFSIPAPVIGLKLRTDQDGGKAYVNTAIFAGFGYFGAALCLFLLRGYIIARDRESSLEGIMDQDELDVKVTPKQFLKALFVLRSTQRKV